MTGPTLQRGSSVSRLADTVLAGGYCIGCGACAAAAPDAFRMQLDDAGRWQARLNAEDRSCDVPVNAVCPFGEDGLDEDRLAQEHFDVESLQHHPGIGYYSSIWAGHASDVYRSVGSSGGLASWFAAELLERGSVDAVAHALPVEGEDGLLFRYGVSRTTEDLLAGSKSHYHSVEMSDVLRQMRSEGGRYLVVGVPCFIKAVRNLCAQDPELDARVRFTAAIFCGHMKSTAYAKLLGWQMGVEPTRLRGISFREKLLDRPADKYGTRVWNDVQESVTRPASEMPATNWGLGYFKFQACDFCDDISGETADIAFGDAWLPRFTEDPKGTSLVVVRRQELADLLEERRLDGTVELEPVTAEAAMTSQDANFRHRREGLAYRLAVARAAGRWTPPKRVAPFKAHLPRRDRQRFDLRTALSASSHQAFCRALVADDLETFVDEMSPLVRRYDEIMRPHLPTLVARRIRRWATASRRRRGFFNRSGVRWSGDR